MAMRLIPFSIVATIVGVIWLSVLLSMDQEAIAEANNPVPTVEEVKEQAVAPVVPASAEEATEEKQPEENTAPAPAEKAANVPVKAKDITLLSPDHLRLVFSTRGGGLKSALLLNDQFDRKEDETDQDGVGVPEEKLAAGPLDIVTTWDQEFYPFQETLQVCNWVDENDVKEPVVAGGEAGTKRTKTYGIVDNTEQSVTLVWPDPAIHADSPVYFQKTIRLKEGYALDVEFSVYNFSDRKLDLRINHEIFGWQATAEGSMIGTRPNLTAGTCLVGGETLYESFDELLDAEGGTIFTSGDVSWVGISDQYFLLATIPTSFPAASCALQAAAAGGHGEASIGLVEAGIRQNQTHSIHPEKEASCLPEWLSTKHPANKEGIPSCTELQNVLSVQPGETLTRAKKRALIQAKGDTAKIEAISSAHERLAHATNLQMGWTLYVGPKDIGEMEKLGEDTNLSATLDFGILEFISSPMLLMLRWGHGVLNSWALAIVLLTILVKMLLFPLTRKSLVQMKRMQELKPEMDKVKEKYEDDKQKLNQEMFALYKKHGVNPLGGCLPMFLQMPIYIALYETLYASVSLYQEPLFGWVDDLTSPDPYYVLPLILGATMFIQQKMNPTTMDSQQAQIMMYVMPVMFTGFMLFLPSGLVLYIFTNTVLTLVQQFFLNRKPTV